MIENYTRLSSRMFTATVVGKDKNGRKITEGREKASMANGELLTYFNYGEIIATAELVACHLITEEYLSTLPDTEKALGDYSLGRYAWELRNIKELPEPIKAKGQQGIWNWEA